MAFLVCFASSSSSRISLPGLTTLTFVLKNRLPVMVAFKRFFQTDRYPSTGVGGQDVGLTTTDSQSDAQSRVSASVQLPVKTARPADGSMDAERHFQRIEKQLEELHDSLQTRPIVQVPSRTSSRFAVRNPRHVDLFDAVSSSSQRHQAQQPSNHHPQQQQHHHHHNNDNRSPSSASPVSPYNEDVAERNMTQPFQKPPRKRNLYTRLISALHQDDVADRNMSKGKDGARPRSRSTNTRPANNKSSVSPNANNGAKATENKPSTGLVPREAATRPRSRGNNEPVTSTPPRETQTRPHLRSQRSAPNLSTAKSSPPFLQKGPERSPDPGPVGHLSVPPAHKQGDAWSSTPLPDSPTLPGQPTATGRRDRSATEASATTRKAHSTLARASPSKPPSRPAPSRKNTLNLSINTQVAALGRKPAKLSPRAIQPPTPSNNDTKYNPSIAEVMNSPLPSATPTSVSPLPSSNQKVAEIMDMFKQAYNSSSAKPISPHPTFETLQDAIVREINSHEAFRCLPAPAPGPAFTPSPARESFDRHDSTSKPVKNSSTSVSGNGSAKENQLSKLIKPNPFKKHRRDSEARRSISTSVVPAVLNRVSTSDSRRRHTDAPPPSPGFLDEPATQEEEKDEPMPSSYKELPLRSQTVSPGVTPSTTTKKRSASLSKTHAPSQSVVTLASLASPASSAAATAAAAAAGAGTAGQRSVYYMRAQTSPISSDGKTSFSAGDSSDGYSEEDVLQLPSPSPTSTPQHGHEVENSVDGSTSATTLATAKSRWSIFPPKSSTTTVSVASLSSSSGHHHQQHCMREVRSVEDY